MCYWKPTYNTRRIYRQNPVSILLILDVLLEEDHPEEGEFVIFKVSILLILDVLLEVYDTKPGPALQGTFQSFLYWMCYWKFFWKQGGFLVKPVSILLILDVLLEASTGKLTLTDEEGFNPSYTGCATGRIFPCRHMLSFHWRFNPSYTGCATGSRSAPVLFGILMSSFNPSYTGCATGRIRIA